MGLVSALQWAGYRQLDTRPTESHRRTERRSILQLCQGLIKIGNEVIHVLDAHREAHEVLAEVRRLELLGAQLRVRGRRLSRDRKSVV